jgi:hypothetical protein
VCERCAEAELADFLGVRWQAQRDTALDCSSLLDCKTQSAVAASLCRRTPNSNFLLILKGEAKVKLITAVILCVVALAIPAFAQDKPVDTNMQILLDKVKADKKLVVAANMELSEAEAKAFWPIYEVYQKELQAINERTGKTILAYADAYNKKAMTDDLAKQLTKEALAIDQDELTLRKSSAAKLNGVLPAMKVARYIQIENKIRAALRYDLAAGIPLVP